MANSFLNGGYINVGNVSWAPRVSIPGPTLSLTATSNGPVEQFSGLPFDLALGEVYGLRVWRVDVYGRLRARHVAAEPWRPGVNVAKCHADPSMRASTYYTYRGQRIASTETKYTNHGAGVEYVFTLEDGSQVSTTDVPETQIEPGPTHDAPDESCRCGFYAYTELDHIELDYNPHERMVIGVVKGTGRTLLGSQGFRSEKAEIVALVNPAGTGEGAAGSNGKRLAAQIAKVYPDIPMFGTRRQMLEFAPVESQMPDPSTDEFWSLP